MTRFISLMAMLGTMPALAAWGSTGGDDMVAVAAGGPVDSLDKSGTSGVRQKSGALQAIEWSALAKRRSFAAEREGFEPSVALLPHRFSRPARSATPAPLRACFSGFYV